MDRVHCSAYIKIYLIITFNIFALSGLSGFSKIKKKKKKKNILLNLDTYFMDRTYFTEIEN